MVSFLPLVYPQLTGTMSLQRLPASVGPAEKVGRHSDRDTVPPGPADWDVVERVLFALRGYAGVC